MWPQCHWLPFIQDFTSLARPQHKSGSSPYIRNVMKCQLHVGDRGKNQRITKVSVNHHLWSHECLHQTSDQYIQRWLRVRMELSRYLCISGETWFHVSSSSDLLTNPPSALDVVWRQTVAFHTSNQADRVKQMFYRREKNLETHRLLL